MAHRTPEPRVGVETIIVDEHESQLAVVNGAAIWPVVGAIIELGEPMRDAVVRDVRLRPTSTR